MVTKATRSLKGRTMRLTRLNNCGVPVIGVCSSLVTNGFITVDFAPEMEAGEEYISKNAWGDFCINEKDYDRMKWLNVTITMCEVHPDVLDIVAGAKPITDGTDKIGASFGQDGSTAAFGLEVWTKQAGNACVGGAAEWGYFVVPLVMNGNIDGSVTIEQGALTMGLKGEGMAATSAWATNPYPDNPLMAVAGFPVGDYWAVVRTTVQPPAATASCVALV